MNVSQQIPVAYRPKPFASEIVRGAVPEGTSILEIVRILRVPRHFHQYGMVCINGEPVPQRMWRYVRPKLRGEREVTVTLHIRLHDDATKDIIKLVATIVVIAAATLVTGGALAPLLGATFAAGGIGALLGGAAISIGGLLAVNALIPPPSVKSSPAALGATSATTSIASSASGGPSGRGAASLSGNVLSPGVSIPRVFGTMRVFPPFVSEPLIEPVGDNQVAEGIVALAGPHDISDVKAAGTPITDMEGIEYEIASNPTLVQRYGRTTQLGISLSQHKIAGPDNPERLDDQEEPTNSLPVFHRISSFDGPDEIWIPLVLGEGVYHADHPEDKYAFPLRVRVRLLGDDEWINFPEVHFFSRLLKPAVVSLRLLFRDPNEIPTPPDTNQGFYYASKNVPVSTADPEMGGWIADDHFSSGGGNDVYNTATASTTNVRYVGLWSDRVEFWLPGFTLGVYEIEIIQGALYAVADFNQSNYHFDTPDTSPPTLPEVNDDVIDLFGYWHDNDSDRFVSFSLWSAHYKINVPSISSVWNSAPVIGDDLTCVAIKATNRQVSEISVLASGLVPDHIGGTWQGLVATSNPASHFRDLLIGSINSDPLPSTMLDDADIAAWHAYCEDQGFECNAVADGQPVFTLATMIASCGFARPRQCEKWGVMIDKPRAGESVVQVFSFRNMSSFRWEKAFTRKPSGFRVNFINRDLDYADDEIIIDDPAATVSGRYEQIRYDGIVDEDRARERALFDLAQARARATFYYGTTNIQNIVARRGDLVGVQHDILDHVAGSAYIKEVIYDDDNPELIVGFTLDGSIPIAGVPVSVIVGGGGFGAYGEFAAGEPSDDTPDPQPVTEGGLNISGAKNGIAIRVSDVITGLHRIIILQAWAGFDDETKQVACITPFVDNAVKPGLLLTSGVIGTEFKRLYLMSVLPKADLSADLVFVDEAPEIFDVIFN